LLNDYRGYTRFGAHYNQEVRFSSAVKFELRCLTALQIK